MGLKIHNAPQGKTNYADDGNDWPYLCAQTKLSNRFPKDVKGNAQAWETQLAFATGINGQMCEPGAPLWAEAGDQDITVPVAFQLCTIPGMSGEVIEVWGEYANHTRCTLVMDQPGPYVATDPNVMPVYTGKLTFNLAAAAKADPTGLSPLHGWTEINLRCRTRLSNTDTFDTTMTLPVYSIVDVTQPEATVKEEGLCLKAASNQWVLSGVTPFDVDGAGLVVVRDQSIPALGPSVPFEKSYVERVIAYDYGQDPSLETPDGQKAFVYTVEVDGDDDKGLAPVQLFTTPFGTTGNFDVLDAVTMSQSTQPDEHGLKPWQHMLALVWRMDTSLPTLPLLSPHSNQIIPPGIFAETILEIIVTVGPNPTPAPPLTLLTVPDLMGLTTQAAVNAIVAAGFRVGDISHNIVPDHPDWPADTVWTQNPVVGPQGVPPGTLFDIGVGWGGSMPAANPVPDPNAVPSPTPAPSPTPPPLTPPPSAATVPSVVGLTQSAADAAITGAQLKPLQETTAYSDTVAKGDILSQTPSSGAFVPASSVVQYVVSLGPQTPSAVPTPAPTPTPAKTLTLPLTIQDANGVTITVT